MAKVLAQLLDQPEVLVESAVKKLENLSGFNGTDVRLLADINNKVRTKTAQLGLDPDDTTGPELYRALLVKLAADEQKLNLSSEEFIKKTVKLYKPYKVYALKHSVAKELLRKHPPRKLMKQLNYRSVDSMLKRQNVCELFAALEAVELPRWMDVFWKNLAHMTPSDFEPQKVEITTMLPEYWSFLKDGQVVTNNPLLGTINIWPSSSSPISLGLQIAQNIDELRATSALIKLWQVEGDFGKKLVQFLRSGPENPLEISHLPIDWLTIFHHFGKRSKSEHTEFFGPLLLHEDIKIAQSLIQVSPVFEWWQDLEHVAKITKEGLVSLNLADVLSCQTSKTSYQQRSVDHVRGSVWRELVDRYMAHPSIEAYLMNQLGAVPTPAYEFNNSVPQKVVNNFAGAT